MSLQPEGSLSSSPNSGKPNGTKQDGSSTIPTVRSTTALSAVAVKKAREKAEREERQRHGLPTESGSHAAAADVIGNGEMKAGSPQAAPLPVSPSADPSSLEGALVVKPYVPKKSVARMQVPKKLSSDGEGVAESTLNVKDYVPKPISPSPAKTSKPISPSPTKTSKKRKKEQDDSEPASSLQDQAEIRTKKWSTKSPKRAKTREEPERGTSLTAVLNVNPYDPSKNVLPSPKPRKDMAPENKLLPNAKHQYGLISLAPPPMSGEDEDGEYSEEDAVSVAKPRRKPSSKAKTLSEVPKPSSPKLKPTTPILKEHGRGKRMSTKSRTRYYESSEQEDADKTPAIPRPLFKAASSPPSTPPHEDNIHIESTPLDEDIDDEELGSDDVQIIPLSTQSSRSNRVATPPLNAVQLTGDKILLDHVHTSAATKIVDNLFSPNLGINYAHLTWTVSRTQQDDDVMSESAPETTPATRRKGLLVGLQPKETFRICGTCQLTILRGSVSLYGATLTASTKPVSIFAPTTSPLPTVTALDHVNTAQNGATNKVLSLLPDGVEIEPPVKDDPFSDCPILLSLVTLETGIERVERLLLIGGSIARSKRMWQATQPLHQDRSQYHLRCALPSSESRYECGFDLVHDPCSTHACIQGPDSWKASLKSLGETQTQPPVVYIEGGKGAGKSTFGKMCLNTLLSQYSRVAWLDMDFGQPEFTPTAMASLHILDTHVIGPNFCHLRKPIRAHFLGRTTAFPDPDYALSAFDNLLSHYRTFTDSSDDLNGDDIELGSWSHQIPLIVNTDSWNRPSAVAYKQACLDLLRPTHHFCLGAPSPCTPPNAINLAQIQTSGNSTHLTPNDSRDLTLLSYFYRLPETQSWDFTSCLSIQRTLGIQWTSPLVKGIALVENAGIPYSKILHALNRSIVAMIADDEVTTQEERPGVFLPYLNIQDELPDPSKGTCIGLACIRNIKSDDQLFHVLTPLQRSELENPTMWLRGTIEMPKAAQLDQFCDEHGRLRSDIPDNIPYFSRTGTGEGARRIRRNLGRRSQQAS